jgi:hypothetical protein
MSLAAMASVALSVAAHAGGVVVEIIDSQGRVFQQVPTKAEAHAYRAYLEAERDARYRIRIRNSTGARVGVVVAVDGRNIISGVRSELANDEPMYILDGWDTQQYSGWRANLKEVNEFYFTEWKDSYAEAFGDRTARGVIAVAVYREKAPKRLFHDRERRGHSESRLDSVDRAGSTGLAASEPVPSAPSASAGPGARDEAAAPSIAQNETRKKAERSEAGTGYGDRRPEYVTQVEFDAEPRASERLFLEYEWRETLCSKRILACDDSPPNRFWPTSTYGFAPPPPGRHR